MKNAVQIEGLKRNNIGDVLQAIAVADHLPEPPLVLDRENLHSASCLGPLLFFANGWYMHDYSKFPPPPNLVPVYASVHFSNAAILQDRRNVRHFKTHGPIGARDRTTLFMLRAAGIPSYYSGCFTTGIKRRGSSSQPDGGLLVVDGIDHPLSDTAVETIGRRLGMQPRRISHDPDGPDLPFEDYARESLLRADGLLRTYCSSASVVTTKIHCALPCLAMGVPVILVHPNPAEERLAPAAEFLKVVSLERLESLHAGDSRLLNAGKLQQRREWIFRFISEAVACGGNPVRLSPSFASLRAKARAQTVFWSAALRACHRLGIQRHRLGKIFDAKTPAGAVD
jgi:hypothetical protein